MSVSKTPSSGIAPTFRLIVLCFHLLWIPAVRGHGYMYTPRSLNWRAHQDGVDGGSAPGDISKEYCYHCLNHKDLDGVCGKSGTHNYDDFRDVLGNPIEWKSEEVYTEGDIITVKSYLNTHHWGHVEMRACPDGENPTQACLESHILSFVDDPKYGSPPNPTYNYYGHYQDLNKVDYEMHFQLPDGLYGEKVMLQYKYVTANSCNPPGYLTYPWPSPSWWQGPTLGNCKVPYPEDGSRPSRSPEQFWNCAQVTILPRGPTPPVTPEAPPTGSPAISSPVTAVPVPVYIPSLEPVSPSPAPMTPTSPVTNPTFTPVAPTVAPIAPTLGPEVRTPVPVAPPSDEASYCCSWDYGTCGDSEWCNISSSRCSTSCGGSWISANLVCTPKWGDCTQNASSCCAPSSCKVQNRWYSQCL